MGFTTNTFKKLLHVLIYSDYNFQTFEQFIVSPKEKTIILRHDIDRLPVNAFHIAQIEKSFDISTSYYFRALPCSFDEKIIKQIAELGHEIGYHYECLAEINGDYERAIEDFELNLCNLRNIYPVHNIAMHGRPTSKWDSRDLWKKYNYRNYGIISEPYFDIDFNKVSYITDAGRS